MYGRIRFWNFWLRYVGEQSGSGRASEKRERLTEDQVLNLLKMLISFLDVMRKEESIRTRR